MTNTAFPDLGQAVFCLMAQRELYRTQIPQLKKYPRNAIRKLTFDEVLSDFSGRLVCR